MTIVLKNIKKSLQLKKITTQLKIINEIIKTKNKTTNIFLIEGPTWWRHVWKKNPEYY